MDGIEELSCVDEAWSVEDTSRILDNELDQDSEDVRTAGVEDCVDESSVVEDWVVVVIGMDVLVYIAPPTCRLTCLGK